MPPTSKQIAKNLVCARAGLYNKSSLKKGGMRVPNVTVSLLRGRAPQQRAKIMQTVKTAVMEGFAYHGKGLSVRIIEFDEENFLPPGRSGEYMIVEAVCFPGRTAQQLRDFYRILAWELDAIGEDSGECLMMVRDLPLERWGMAGGKCAADLFT